MNQDEVRASIKAERDSMCDPDEVNVVTNQTRYFWLRDVADGSARDDVLGRPCGLTQDEDGYKEAHARVVDAAIDEYLLAHLRNR